MLQTTAGDEIQEERIRRDIRALWSTGLLDNVEVSSDVSPSGRSITFVVRERPLVRTWTVQGASALDPQRVRDTFGKDGEVLNLVTLREQISRVGREYTALGYRSVDIQFRVDPLVDNKVDVNVQVKEGPKALIQSIRFQGVAKARQPELAALIETGQGQFNTAGTLYRPDSLEHDGLMMTAYYFDRGMLNAQVSTEQATLSEDRTLLNIVIEVSEGPVYRIGKIGCAGDLAATEKKCVELLGSKKGEVFSRAQLLKGIERVRDFQNQNRRGTTIDPQTQFDPAKQTIDLKLVVGK
jgi:outer membrane protein insertion porin family